MKTSILFLVASLGLGASHYAWAQSGGETDVLVNQDQGGGSTTGGSVTPPVVTPPSVTVTPPNPSGYVTPPLSGGGNAVTLQNNTQSQWTNQGSTYTAPSNPNQVQNVEMDPHQYKPDVIAQDMKNDGKSDSEINSTLNHEKTDKDVTVAQKKKSGKGRSGGCGDGTFGGESCDTTDTINMGIDVANKLYQSVGSAAVQNKGTDVQNTLNAKGINVSNADYLNGQADAADAAKKANNTAGMLQVVNAGIQGMRAMQHKRSATQVAAQCDAITDETRQSQCVAEAKAQKNKALESTVKAALTAEQAGASLMQGNMAGKTADELRKQAQLGAGGTAQYTYTNPTMTTGDQGALVPTTAVDTSAITATDPGAAGNLDGGIKDFNPNLGDNGALGPTPGAFTPDAGKGAAGGGQGSGLGGSGGTSASKPDGAADTAGASKPQTGGQYAAGDGGSPKFGRSGGSGAGVGVDTSFADMLKNMLPGSGDDKKKDGSQASLDLNSDRSPASDQAAVIGRNKNIFIEISKRYQKKNSEGAVVFQ